MVSKGSVSSQEIPTSFPSIPNQKLFRDVIRLCYRRTFIRTEFFWKHYKVFYHFRLISLYKCPILRCPIKFSPRFLLRRLGWINCLRQVQRQHLFTRARNMTYQENYVDKSLETWVFFFWFLITFSSLKRIACLNKWQFICDFLQYWAIHFNSILITSVSHRGI